MTVEEFDIALSDLETRIDRLRALYENWFRGYEKTEPSVPRKDAERRVYALRKELPRNTALRFRYHQTYLKYTTLANYWQRTARQIEEGTYKPQLQRLKRKLDREQEQLERRERRKLERAEDRKEDGPPGYELDLDESLDVDDLLDELEMDEVAKAIDRPGPHSEPPPTTVHQRLAPANGPSTATFSRLKDNPPKPSAPQATQDAPPRGAAFPNAPFPNAPFPNAPGKTGPMAAPPLAGSTTLGRPAPPANAPASPAAARGPAPLATPQASRPGGAPFAGPFPPTAPGSGAQRPFPNVPPAPNASSSNGASAPTASQGTRPAAPNSLAGAPARPASTTIGRPAPAAPAAPVGTAGQRPLPAAPAATAAQRPAPATPAGTAGQRPLPPAPAGSAAQRMSGAGAPGGGTYVGRPPVTSPLAGPAGAPNEQRLRNIYDEYAAARRRNNEGEVRYEALVSSIQKMLPELNKKHHGKQIDFDVVVKDGRVGLKPKAT
jgi:hypothetical protein